MEAGQLLEMEAELAMKTGQLFEMDARQLFEMEAGHCLRWRLDS